MKRLEFDVLYDFTGLPDPWGKDYAEEFRVHVTMKDRIDVEQHGHKIGVVDHEQQPQALGAAWLWYAARREGRIPAETTWEDFIGRCLDNQAVEQAGEVPPTREEGSAPSSSSLTTSPASTGSTTATTSD